MLLVSTAFFAFAFAYALAQSPQTCRFADVAPTTEQCGFDYNSIRKDGSAGNVSNAYQTCAHAQEVAAVCVSSSNEKQHGVSLDSLYRDVTLEGEIAMYAQRFTVALALLKERQQVLAIMRHDGRVPDAQLASEQKLIDGDVNDASAGECATHQYDRAPEQAQLARSKAYPELARFLNAKFRALQACAKGASIGTRRAYIQYLSYVALEEAGRSAQAAGNQRGATVAYDSCIDGTGRASTTADDVVRTQLKAVKTICQARAAGKLAVDKPEPIDAGAERFVASPKP